MEYCLSNKLKTVLLVALVVTTGCKNQEQKAEETPAKKQEYIMYQPSEMANLMNAMYAYNLQIKNQIEAGETPLSMPLDLMQLHTAEMTKGKGRTEAWQSFVNLYIDSQHSISDSLSTEDLKLRYNEAINNCLGCHKTECTGPIPRIRKLLIQ